MIITALMVLLVGTIFIQPNAQRLFAALVFAGGALSHDVLFSGHGGLLYYGSAALFDLGVLMLISGIRPITKTIAQLHVICLASVLVNFAGWVIWWLYLPPAAYNLAFVTIYCWALVTLTRRNGADVGGFGLASWRACFCFNLPAGMRHSNRDTGKV